MSKKSLKLKLSKPNIVSSVKIIPQNVNFKQYLFTASLWSVYI